MAMRPATYYFGRLNLVPIIDDLQKKTDFILEALRSNKTMEKRGHIWRFSKIGNFSNDDGLYVYGYLVKYKAQVEEEVIVPETGDIEDEAIDNSIIAKSRFFLHIKSGLVAYRPISNKISESQFREQFAELIETAYDHFFVEAQIQSIQDRIQFQEALRRTENVSRIQFILQPSNPSAGIWEDLDKDFKLTGTKQYVEIRDMDEQRTNGSIILDNGKLLEKLLMSEDGYGETRVTGKLDGKVRTISTKDNPVTAKASSEDKDVDSIFSSLQGIITNIFDRLHQ
ncbi:MAG: hypothetical protein EI684_19925 [Candidatus Viridilinea halotolerans]|uniref:DUF4747 family protein n=1 Tax=Candidatus Viridilinea halotolerans TaxID=2491704 RepID=A0A426TSB9_9CHLR|nr:MAG: hypothetical protein EI684_19925 [Candidatus Viridilinea halotolerans]